ncbi:probable 6-phosphogluconolactonase 1 [Tanacetum coccineum]|uniref:Probable 6-phosphogluconolactonase 1 n=1 Tax=Tanacetum coccineum TaxID=301880 RepID=A0ABQ5C7W7_9ASTR
MPPITSLPPLMACSVVDRRVPISSVCFLLMWQITNFATIANASAFPTSDANAGDDELVGREEQSGGEIEQLAWKQAVSQEEDAKGVLCISYGTFRVKKDSGEVRIHESLEELSTDLADYIAELSEASVKERGFFTIVLSGGSLISLVRNLSGAPYNKTVDWSKWYIFWADERVVAKNHVDSNYKLAKDHLLSKTLFTSIASSYCRSQLTAFLIWNPTCDCPHGTAVLFGNKDVARYLYKLSKDLSDDAWNPKNRGWLLEKCVESDMFGNELLKCLETEKTRSRWAYQLWKEFQAIILEGYGDTMARLRGRFAYPLVYELIEAFGGGQDEPTSAAIGGSFNISKIQVSLKDKADQDRSLVLQLIYSNAKYDDELAIQLYHMMKQFQATTEEGSMKECGDDDASKRCCNKGMVEVMEKLKSDNAKMMKLMKQIWVRN